MNSKESVKDIIEELRAIREEKGVSQRQLAKLLKVRQCTISDMERLKSNPSILLVVGYANVFGYKMKLEI